MSTVLAVPQVALADAAGPTDFRTQVISVSPSTDVIDVSIEGGDSFVRIVVSGGHEVTVLGYDDEPYLRITADGTVEENRLSPATYYNADRNGAEIPDFVDDRADPEWHDIGTEGSWAWHDHRAHWMGSEPPIGLEAGESLPSQLIPLIVDGERVEIEVQTTLQSSPSNWPAVVGLLVGLIIVLFGVLAGPATLTLSSVLLASAATVVGVSQFRSLPGETGPLTTWWLLPTLALACTVAAIATYGRSMLIGSGLVLLSGVQLELWAFRRRATLTKAVLPTDLPFWLDRTVTAAVLTGGAILIVAGLLTLFRPPDQPSARSIA
jgi:hypothetical protein